MAVFVGESPPGVPGVLDSFFALAEDVHQGLERVHPSLSADQLEQINHFLLSNGGFVYQLLQLRIDDAAQMFGDDLLQEYFQELSKRLDHNRSASWISFVVRALSLLNTKAGLHGARFVVLLWNIVAVPAEAKYGIGYSILRMGIDIITSEQASNWGDDLNLLIYSVLATLRSSRNPSPISASRLRDPSAEAVIGVLDPSPARLRLGIKAAAYILSMVKHGEQQSGDSPRLAEYCCEGGGIAGWRWELHLEVSRYVSNFGLVAVGMMKSLMLEARLPRSSSTQTFDRFVVWSRSQCTIVAPL